MSTVRQGDVRGEKLIEALTLRFTDSILNQTHCLKLTDSIKVKHWMAVPTSLLWGEHSVCGSNQACEMKDWICCRSNVFQEVAEVLEMVDSVGAGLYLYIIYVLYSICICILIHETQSDRPHIWWKCYKQGYCCTFSRLAGEISKNEGGRPKQNLRNQKGN